MYNNPELESLFSSRYLASYRVNVNNDLNEVIVGGRGTYMYSGNPTISATLDFHDIDGFKQFLSELSQIQNMIDEHKARLNNPTIQRAYDEYRLLLKLAQ